jgi:putative endonuclease
MHDEAILYSCILELMSKSYYVYILTNKWNIVLYAGITDNLVGRTWQHKEKVVKSFTSKYNINKLVYYEVYQNPEEAIKREKQLKGGSRKKKIDLITKMNPEWKDLYEDLI